MSDVSDNYLEKKLEKDNTKNRYEASDANAHLQERWERGGGLPAMDSPKAREMYMDARIQRQGEITKELKHSEDDRQKHFDNVLRNISDNDLQKLQNWNNLSSDEQLSTLSNVRKCLDKEYGLDKSSPVGVYRDSDRSHGSSLGDEIKYNNYWDGKSLESASSGSSFEKRIGGSLPTEHVRIRDGKNVNEALDTLGHEFQHTRQNEAVLKAKREGKLLSDPYIPLTKYYKRNPFEIDAEEFGQDFSDYINIKVEITRRKNEGVWTL